MKGERRAGVGERRREEEAGREHRGKMFQKLHRLSFSLTEKSDCVWSIISQ